MFINKEKSRGMRSDKQVVRPPVELIEFQCSIDAKHAPIAKKPAKSMKHLLHVFSCISFPFLSFFPISLLLSRDPEQISLEKKELFNLLHSQAPERILINATIFTSVSFRSRLQSKANLRQRENKNAESIKFGLLSTRLNRLNSWQVFNLVSKRTVFSRRIIFSFTTTKIFLFFFCNFCSSGGQVRIRERDHCACCDLFVWISVIYVGLMWQFRRTTL